MQSYDGASGNCFSKKKQKKNLRFFSCCFWKNGGENKLKKKILLFLEKRWRKKLEFFFLPFTLAPSYNQYHEDYYIISEADELVHQPQTIYSRALACDMSIPNISSYE